MKKDQYTIIRPGVLIAGKNVGATGIEFNQGDLIGGSLTREELGNVVAGAIENKKSAGKTIEVYRKTTRTKLMPEYGENSGREKYSDSWTGLWD